MGSEDQKVTADMNEYLNSVLTGKVKMEGIEGTVVRRLQEDDEESRRLESIISQLTQQLDSARLRSLNLQGRREAYIQLLVDEELDRRKRKSISDPTKVQLRGSVLSEEERSNLGDVLGMNINEAKVVPARMAEKKERLI
jgi:hypothetical protein